MLRLQSQSLHQAPEDIKGTLDTTRLTPAYVCILIRLHMTRQHTIG